MRDVRPPGSRPTGETATQEPIRHTSTPPRRVPTALTIAGSDSGGGAGLQADLKTFHRFGVYGTCAVTLVTVQNTRGVQHVETMRPELVARQIDAVVEDLGADAVKTGALGSAGGVAAVADAVARHRLRPLVVDPVLVSKHGTRLLDHAGVRAMRERLLPLATLVTPNLAEAEALLEGSVRTEKDMREACRALRARGAGAVLLTGGHLAGSEAVDLLDEGDELLRLAAPRIDTPHTHGTGCTLSAAIAAGLARGETLPRAVRAAKAFVSRAIAGAPGLGGGHGPLDHWA